jgi:presenilin-like A22 family membrane protease
MFVVTQLIGLIVVHAYTPNIQQVDINGTFQNITVNPLPYGLESPDDIEQGASLISIVIAFAIAICFIFLLTKIKAAMLIRLWFFVVVALVLAITFYAFEILAPLEINYKTALIIPLVISIPLAYIKVFKQNVIIHNLTELFIYPGIASVFVPLLGLWSIIVLLIIISLYDMWAVWHTGFMQKMAKYQMNELKIFGGFFVPYLNKKQRQQIKEAKLKIKAGKKPKKKTMKVNLAILGGGDVVFPIITAGIILRLWGLLPALIVIAGAAVALLALFAYSKKGKFYPAMPFITAGLLIGIAIAYLI